MFVTPPPLLLLCGNAFHDNLARGVGLIYYDSRSGGHKMTPRNGEGLSMLVCMQPFYFIQNV